MDDFFRIIGILILLFLIAVMIGVVRSANAESAIVSFNDAEHLATLTDSVVGVCDTLYWIEYPCHQNADSIRTRDSIIGTRVYAFYPTDSIEIKSDHYGMPVYDTCRTYYYPSKITCRELVCVTKMKDPSFGPISENKWITYPGEAIIFYEEVER